MLSQVSVHIHKLYLIEMCWYSYQTNGIRGSHKRPESIEKTTEGWIRCQMWGRFFTPLWRTKAVYSCKPKLRSFLHDTFAWIFGISFIYLGYILYPNLPILRIFLCWEGAEVPKLPSSIFFFISFNSCAYDGFMKDLLKY